MDRRTYAQTDAAGAGPASGADGRALLHVTDPGERRGEMLYRPLGRTGETVSAIGLGGFHLSVPKLDEAAAIRLVHAAVDRGITFMDNSWDYADGEAERRMGTALAQGGYRDRVYLMTKIDGRTREAARAQLEESLGRLRTDRIDLVQHHEVLRYEDPDRIFAEGGAMEALLEARDAGKIRHIGFTGHKDPRIHLYMLEVAERRGFRFDTVQMPLNLLDAHFRSFSRLVVPEAVRQGVGILGMKSFAMGGLLRTGAPVRPIECLHYALNLPVATVITGIDSPEILDQAFAAARSFAPLDDAALGDLLERARPYAMDGRFELFKTSAILDSTALHPDWLGEASEASKALLKTLV